MTDQVEILLKIQEEQICSIVDGIEKMLREESFEKNGIMHVQLNPVLLRIKYLRALLLKNIRSYTNERT
jgi:hypothetical protein